jgi:alpha-N-arabinofuranosidase
MILTDGGKMVLTPTYYVYKLYVPFQGAQLLPIALGAEEYRFDKIALPKVDAIAARGKDGKIWLALTNLDPNNPADITPVVAGVSVKAVVGEVLTAGQVDAINTFEAPGAVAPRPIRANVVDGTLRLHLPPKSVAVVSLEP